MNDVLLVTPSNQLENILNVFNEYHERLQFIVEIEKERCINLNISKDNQ